MLSLEGTRLELGLPEFIGVSISIFTTRKFLHL